MRQLRRVAYELPVCVVPLACHSPVGLEERHSSGYTPVLPNVEGEWLVTTSEMERYLTGAASGSCQAVEFGLDLDRTAERRRYEGSHEGFSVLCAGTDGSGAEGGVGVTDLALSVDSGPITA